MASTTASENIVNLTTSDNAPLKVERKVAERSILIKNLLEDLGGETTESIPIPNVCSHPAYLLFLHS
jgi:S-phase kinase-associated protein 1